MPVAKALRHYLEHRAKFLIVGLTGRTGSGCTTAAKLLGTEFRELKLDEISYPFHSADDRKYRVLIEYADKNWNPFHQISVTQVISTFLLDCSPEEISKSSVFEQIGEKDRSAFLAEFARIRESWKTVSQIVKSEYSKRGRESEVEAFLEVWQRDISSFLDVARRSLGKRFSSAFQVIGDNLRKSGHALESDIRQENFFALPNRVCEIVVAIRQLDERRKKRSYFVIDALRNPFEIQYYRDRFAPFYLVAVTTDDEDRIDRLRERLDFNTSDIKRLDSKEYPSENKPLDGYDQFVSQNIQACLEKAEVFVHNPGRAKSGQALQTGPLTRQLVKFVTLMQHPGLVTPSRIERCMQIAYSARSNSGCISRQVGAAVTDKNFSVKAVGWNDVPEGQVPCLLRKAEDLIDDRDDSAFSVYESSTQKFRDHIAKSLKGNLEIVREIGLGTPYCFKSQYNALEHPSVKGGNQVHTRSLHAEENAFLQLAKYGGPGIFQGILFTTASPCELCAKKAFQLGIKKIYYIDPYPGISMSHILNSGPAEDRRPKTKLFFGAVGQAFHRLYDPILPFKDELSAFMRREDIQKA